MLKEYFVSNAKSIKKLFKEQLSKDGQTNVKHDDRFECLLTKTTTDITAKVSEIF